MGCKSTKPVVQEPVEAPAKATLLQSPDAEKSPEQVSAAQPVDVAVLEPGQEALTEGKDEAPVKVETPQEEPVTGETPEEPVKAEAPQEEPPKVETPQEEPPKVETPQEEPTVPEPVTSTLEAVEMVDDSLIDLGETKGTGGCGFCSF